MWRAKLEAVKVRAKWSATVREDLPTAARAWMTELHPDFDERLKNHAVQQALSAVVHSSRFLTRLLISDATALDVLAKLDERVDPPTLQPNDRSDRGERLVIWKQHEMLRIAARDLLGLDNLEQVGANLAQLATDVLAYAITYAWSQEGVATDQRDLVVVGMGKLGANELNYSSDIDIMFCGSAPESVAQTVLAIAGRCFRVDANLRPEGRNGALVRTLESFQEYWRKWAQTWEFQALLKSRAIVGCADASIRFQEAVDAALWTRDFDADDLRAIRSMKLRTEAMFDASGVSASELKRSAGGIRDVEFSLQLLQLVHGRHDSSLRRRSTLDALHQLEHGGYIAHDDANILGEGYRFLRTLEHRLQLVDEQQTHTVPQSRDDRREIAIAMGFDGDDLLHDFDTQLREYRTRVRASHERMYFRPLLEEFAKHQPTSESAATQLAAFGFTDATRTRAAIEELTRGLARSSRLMAQMMPLILGWLSDSPDPDEGLLGLRNILSGFRTPNYVISAFRDSPEVARRLCLLLGTTKNFSRSLSNNPELFDELDDDNTLASTTSVETRIRDAIDWRTDDHARYASLVRQVRLEQSRVAIADIIGVIDSVEASRRRTEIAEATLSIALRILQAPDEIALIGVGRFGGAELEYGSDLDVIVVYDGSGEALQSRATKVASQLVALVGSQDPMRHLFDVDYALRPEGTQGAIVRSLESCREYYERWGSTWERQALVRARPVSGNLEVGSRFADITEHFVWLRELTRTDLREIRMLKARMERERIPRGQDPQFHLKLGLGSLSDVEWTTQLLQLQNDIRETNTLRALAYLREANELSHEDYEQLREAWIFCDRTRNRSHLIDETAGDSLPTSLTQLRQLARSLGISDIRDEYRTVTRRSRNVMERLFYGTQDIGGM